MEYRVIEKTDADYPDFSCLADPPERLYCRGDVSLLKSECIAVVGTRRATAYGRAVTRRLTADCVRNGLTVVSGMAVGVDTAAHETAIEEGGGTIAVLGGGFNHIYPLENTDLSEKIARKGLLLTEYAPDFKPARYSFPARNRIISALSRGVLVTEAGAKSGALLTAYRALDQGKEVFAVPGGIFSPQSEGTNRILLAGHAHITLSGADIFRALGKNYIKKDKIASIQLDIEQEKVLNILRTDGERHIDELAAVSGIEVRRLNTLLFSLEMCGAAEKLPGNVYRAGN
jgi:DNA processing protein